MQRGGRGEGKKVLRGKSLLDGHVSLPACVAPGLAGVSDSEKQDIVRPRLNELVILFEGGGGDLSVRTFCLPASNRQ